MELTLRLRRRSEIFTGGGDWMEITARRTFAAERTALIICDMWDKHWSRGATERVATMAPRINEFAEGLRAKRTLIVHAPSDTMDFYRDHPARRRLSDVAPVEPPTGLTIVDPPLPIDDSDGGSDTGETESRRVWTRQHPAIDIADSDAITDDGTEVYSLFRQTGITSVLIVGVHTNMCVLNRTFAIKNLVRWRFDTVLVRDLTDAMYNPRMPPYVSHQRGTELVVEHIEKYWCPTTLISETLA